MRIVFAGSPDVALPILEYLLASPHEVVGVLSRPDAIQGRGRKMKPSAVSTFATEHEITLYQPQTLRDNAEADTFLRSLEPDLGVVVAYGAILPQNILDIPKHGWINVHFSLLPRWRGAAPVQRALEAGDTETGVSVFQLELALDIGPLYATANYSIPPDKSAGELLQDLASLSIGPVAEALEKIATGVAPTPQASTGATYANQLHPAEGGINWEAPAKTIDRHIKGFTPSPGAWTMWRGLRMKIGVLEQNPTLTVPLPALAPGEIFATRHEVWVGTGSDPVCLGTVAPAGKKLMAAADWARGARLEPGSKFEASRQEVAH